ncbi:uncharacterized protein K444DRAFT_618511 [Hyaloscypha bicolor E]|jgi:hypothetical protein|uniref:Uncharacterized protein n=1 Tax=Hyaloscypha bicolor E TaxID=1095630 RepID=A0A2J6STM6_9HELO|nr:uncharacterized protein K444DRAFT_618511 [Hyaloscypha bicolor E]PMD54053.1 hypothetical protein K444DRAFT_618511 [Hyaloscypha bicolor E]
MSQKDNKVSKGAKKFWNAVSTGWVIEYPNSRDGPRDFFDRRDRTPQGVREEKTFGNGKDRCSDNGEDASDAIFRWKEQLKAAGRC